MVRTTLKINGMMCKHCEAHVNEAIKKNFKVKDVKASHTDKEAVILSEDSLDNDKLKSVIDDTGYELVDITCENVKKKGFLGI